MPLDTSIPLSVKPAQFMSPAEAISLQNLSRQGSLGELQLKQAIDADREMNLMKQLYANPNAVDSKGMPTDAAIRELYAINPKLAAQMAEQRAKAIREAHGAIAPKDYTADSFTQYVKTGDPTVLRPLQKMEHVTTVGPGGRPMTSWVNPYAPPEGGTEQPMPGFLGQLQSLGILQPGMEKDPRVQQVLSGYIGKESGQITPKDEADLKIKLAHLSNEGIGLGIQGSRLGFETGMKPTGGGVGAPGVGGAFNLFGSMPLSSLPGASPAVPARPGSVPLSGVGTPAAFPQPAPRATPATAPAPAVAAPVAPAAVNTPPGLMTPKQQAELAKMKEEKRLELERALPQTVQSAELAINQIDQMLKHPGMKWAVGLGSKAPLVGSEGPLSLPGTSGADFKSFLDQIQGGAFMQAYNNLKGGGQITEIEGKKATQAITRMSSSQSPEEFKNAAREFQQILREGIDRAKRQATGDYSVKSTDIGRNPTSGNPDVRAQADAILKGK